jgi:hypothetical protein
MAKQTWAWIVGVALWGAGVGASAPAWAQAPAASAAAVATAAPDAPVAAASASAEPAKAPPKGELRIEVGDKGGPRDPPIVAILVPTVFFLTLTGIVAMSLYASFRKDRERHETLRLVIERGGSIPPELVSPPPKRPTSDLRRGIVLLSGGVGLTILLAAASQERGVWTAGLVPVLLGLGYLAVWQIEARAKRSDDRLG